jgi:ectoine hydroxylase-related dioxygenase (phytanoyl-CoA dioxygenase family)
VVQLINVHKSDHLFRSLATSWQLGHVVGHLAGWTTALGGVRLGQDQVWAKPPGAPPLVFHRDSPYFMFTPSNIVTVWVALDDMDAELGPLEYVKGSHLWGDGRVGSANQFFQTNHSKSLLYSAAERQGLDVNQLEIVSMAGLPKGSISIHDGRTWHGSGKNESRHRPRRGLGLHFIPAQARFTPEAAHSRLWKRYVMVEGGNNSDNNNNNQPLNTTQIPLPDEDFPVTWRPDMMTND